MEKNLKLTKNNTFNNAFAIEFFFAIASHLFLKNYWIFGENILYEATVSNFENQ